MYLDDGLGIEEDDELCKAVENQVKCDLINSGIVPSRYIITCLPSDRHIFVF
jgi:hypothetical protein